MTAPMIRGTARRLGLFRPGVLRHAGSGDRRAVRVLTDEFRTAWPFVGDLCQKPSGECGPPRCYTCPAIGW